MKTFRLARDLRLADEIGEPLRAERDVLVLAALLGGDEALARSPRQLLQAEPDEPRRLGALARLAQRRGDRGGGLHLPVAEIDQRRDRVGRRLRRDLVAELATAGGSRPCRCR